MAVYSEVADNPTAVVAGAGRGLSVGLTGQGETAVGALLEDPSTGAFLFFSAL